MAFTSSSNTGGGAFNTVCRNGRGTGDFVETALSEEKGTDCCANIVVRGVSQLNNSRHFLIYFFFKHLLIDSDRHIP